MVQDRLFKRTGSLSSPTQFRFWLSSHRSHLVPSSLQPLSHFRRRRGLIVRVSGQKKKESRSQRGLGLKLGDKISAGSRREVTGLAQ